MEEKIIIKHGITAMVTLVARENYASSSQKMIYVSDVLGNIRVNTIFDGVLAAISEIKLFII